MQAAPEGQRNHTLNALAFRAGQLVAGGELAEHTGDLLKDAALQTGLPAHEVNQTFASGFGKGLQSPASAPPSTTTRQSVPLSKSELTPPPPDDRDAPPERVAIEATEAYPPEVERPPHPETPGKRRVFSLVKLSEVVTKPADWLIRGHLTTDCLGMIFSDPGKCKTFLAVSMACSVATGTPWYGLLVKQAAVVFIVGEGLPGIKKRFVAYRTRNQVSLDDAPLFISEGPAAMLDSASVDEVVAAVDGIAQQHGPPGLIVIDTVARSFGGGDENSTKDMNLFVQAVDRLRERYKAAVLLVHHSGHGDKSRGRGSMALRGALDFEYRLDRGDDDVIRMDCTKAKDFDRPAPMAFKLRSVELPLTDDDGLPVTSAVLDAVDCAPQALLYRTSAGCGKNQTKAIEVLKSFYAEQRANLEDDGRDPAGARVTVADWRAACKPNLDARQFRDAKRALEDIGMVLVENGFARLVKGGKSANYADETTDETRTKLGRNNETGFPENDGTDGTLFRVPSVPSLESGNVLLAENLTEEEI